jgi:hypothetical protein
MKTKKLRRTQNPRLRANASAGQFVDYSRRNNPRSLNEALANGWKVRERQGLFSPDDNQLESGVEIIENHEHTVRLEVPFNVVTIYGAPRPIKRSRTRRATAA